MRKNFCLIFVVWVWFFEIIDYYRVWCINNKLSKWQIIFLSEIRRIIRHLFRRKNWKKHLLLFSRSPVHRHRIIVRCFFVFSAQFTKAYMIIKSFWDRSRPIIMMKKENAESVITKKWSFVKKSLQCSKYKYILNNVESVWTNDSEIILNPGVFLNFYASYSICVGFSWIVLY